jgi:hypothetical protein
MGSNAAFDNLSPPQMYRLSTGLGEVVIDTPGVRSFQVGIPLLFLNITFKRSTPSRFDSIHLPCRSCSSLPSRMNQCHAHDPKRALTLTRFPSLSRLESRPGRSIPASRKCQRSQTIASSDTGASTSRSQIGASLHVSPFRLAGFGLSESLHAPCGFQAKCLSAGDVPDLWWPFVALFFNRNLFDMVIWADRDLIPSLVFVQAVRGQASLNPKP